MDLVRSFMAAAFVAVGLGVAIWGVSEKADRALDILSKLNDRISGLASRVFALEDAKIKAETPL